MKPFTYQVPSDAAAAVRKVAAEPAAAFLGGGFIRDARTDKLLA